MPAPLIDVDLSSDQKIRLFDAGIAVDVMYWNIHRQVIMTVCGWPHAFVGRSVDLVIDKAEAEFGGL